MQPENQQQPAEDQQVNRGIMRCGQRCGETLADEIKPSPDQVDHSAPAPTDEAV